MIYNNIYLFNLRNISKHFQPNNFAVQTKNLQKQLDRPPIPSILPSVQTMQALDPTQETVRHFNEKAHCRMGERPSIEWDGCWFIECQRKNKKTCCCKLIDGDNVTPTWAITRWTQAYQKK